MSHRPTPEPSRRLRRCLLAVPASSMKMMTKALTTEADAVFLDLEDAVAPNEKDTARSLAIEALTSMDWRGNAKTISLRVNGLDTDWTWRDITAVVEAAGKHIDTIILPKVGGPEDLYAVDMLISQIARSCGFAPPGLEALIETAAGVNNLEAIARYNRDMGSMRLEAMHFGAGDYAASVNARTVEIGGLNPDYPGDQFHFALSRIVAACRANGIIPMDSAYGDFNDPEGYEAAARRAISIGMNGKWAIHPSQIPLANAVFSPSAEEVERARAMLAALDDAAARGLGAVRFEGRMIDAANERMIRTLLATHDRISSQ